MFRFLFQAAFLCVVSPLCRRTTCPTTTTTTAAAAVTHTPRPTKNWNIEQVFAKRCSRARSARDWVGWARSGEGREKGDRERRGGGDYLGPSSAVQPPTLLLLLLLLLPIVEPRGPGEAAPCLAAMQPLYHSNLLIVGAQLAHGGFLLESPNIN